MLNSEQKEMLKEKVYNSKLGRQNSEGIQDYFKKKGIALIEGVSEVNRLSKAVKASDKIASFWEHELLECVWQVSQEGGQYLEWKTEIVPADLKTKYAVFIFSMGMGMGSPFPQPSGQFDLYINGKKILSFKVVKHSEGWINKDSDIDFYYDVRRFEIAPKGVSLVLDSLITQEHVASFGLGFIKIPAKMLHLGKKANIKIVPINRNISKRWFRLDIDRKNEIFRCTDFLSGSNKVINLHREYPAVGEYKVFFGDPHFQSGAGRGGLGMGVGTGSLDENYLYARDVSNLDFFALNENDHHIKDQTDWTNRQKKVKEYNEPGRFIAFPAFEWCSEMYGHRVVYYLKDGYPFFRARKNFDPWAKDNDTPETLWEKLESLNTDFITIPHHIDDACHPASWKYINPQYDRLIEIYQCRGSSEYSGNSFAGSNVDKIAGFSMQDVLSKGKRVGFVAGADGHDACPGNSQGIPKHPQLYHYLGSGLTAILAKELTRESLFYAMKERRTYATTGERIILDFRVNGYVMGSEIPINKIKGLPKVYIKAEGTCNISEIQIIKNGEILATKKGRNKIEEFQFEDTSFNKKEGTYYYAKIIQDDYEMAWSSPVYIRPGKKL